MLFVAQWILISILVTRAAEPLPVILAHLHRHTTCQDKGSKPGGA